MKLIKWFVKDNESIFGTKQVPTINAINDGLTLDYDVVTIAYTLNREIAIGLVFGRDIPAGTQEIISTRLQENTYVLPTGIKKEIFGIKTGSDRLNQETLSTIVKYFRTKELNDLTVKVVGKDNKDVELDANEVSQDRLTRVLSVLDTNEEIVWKAANNEFVSINSTMIKNAIKMAGSKQSALWVKYSF